MGFVLPMRRSIRISLWAIVAGLYLTSIQVQADTAPIVVVLTHDSLTSTSRTVHGVRKVITREHPDAAFHDFLVSDESAAQADLMDTLARIDPTLIVTAGSAATRFAVDNFKQTPIVFSGVKYPQMSGFVQSLDRPGGNVTGASLNIPIDIQFKYFREVVPQLKSIGVLYTASTASLVTQAKVVAQSVGLELFAVEVTDITQLPRALDSVAAVAEGMWAVADPTLFDPRSTRYILLNTMRKGMPFMGFSRHVVESGALFALDFDYKAIGFQAGAIANRIIAGKAPGEVPVTMADVIWFHYNENTAKHISLTMPDELVAIAKEVYR